VYTSIEETMQNTHIDLINEWCNVLEIKTNKDTPTPNKTYFWFKINKKYTRIVKVDGWDHTETVHAFVDNKTLDIYKPASWNTPADGARYNLITTYDELLNDCEWTGGYLYKSGVKKVKAYGC
jgi:hypothetical protein